MRGGLVGILFVLSLVVVVNDAAFAHAFEFVMLVCALFLVNRIDDRLDRIEKRLNEKKSDKSDGTRFS
jgi:hypothetical protein